MPMRPRNWKSCSSGMLSISFAENRNGSGVRPHQSIRELEQHALAAARRPQQDSGFARRYGQRDIFENLLAFKPDRDVIEDNDRLRRIFLGCRGVRSGARSP